MMKRIMFPELETERFYLKEFKPDDQSFVFEALGHPEVIHFYGVHYDSLEDTKQQMDFYEKIWRERTGCWWKIVSKTTGQPAGACGMNYYQPRHEKAEIGYWLLPDWQGKGIMTEVIPVMLRHLFAAWKLHRVEAVIEEGNTSSMRLAERLGFTFEGRLRDAEIKNGKRITLLMYSLLKTGVHQ